MSPMSEYEMAQVVEKNCDRIIRRSNGADKFDLESFLTIVLHGRILASLLKFVGELNIGAQ